MDYDSKMQKHSQILDLVILFLFSAAATVPLLDGNVCVGCLVLVGGGGYDGYEH